MDTTLTMENRTQGIHKNKVWVVHVKVSLVLYFSTHVDFYFLRKKFKFKKNTCLPHLNACLLAFFNFLSSFLFFFLENVLSFLVKVLCFSNSSVALEMFKTSARYFFNAGASLALHFNINGVLFLLLIIRLDIKHKIVLQKQSHVFTYGRRH